MAVTFARFAFQRFVFDPRAYVASVDGRKLFVDVPPLNWMAFVVVLPPFVTVWKSAETLDGQFVPFWRQTENPFTAIEEAKIDVPEAVLNPKYPDDVPFVKVRVGAVSVVMFAVDPVKDWAYRLVEVVLVPVAFVQVNPLNADGVAPVIVSDETEMFVAVAFVAKKFVVVTVVAVTFAIVAF